MWSELRQICALVYRLKRDSAEPGKCHHELGVALPDEADLAARAAAAAAAGDGTGAAPAPDAKAAPMPAK